MHVIRWKKQAVNDLLKITRHIARDIVVNAGKMLDLIQGKVEVLARHPGIGRSGLKSDTYELVVHQNYVVIYRMHAAQVEILRVKHVAQKL